MKSQMINHNFSKEQLKGILRALTEQLGKLEREGDKKEIRNKMLDISHYESMWYNMATWEEYSEFDEELSQIRNN
jgi:hypothetical protein